MYYPGKAHLPAQQEINFNISVISYCICVLGLPGDCAKLPQTGVLKQEKFIFSPFSRPQTLNQDVIRAILSLNAFGENPSPPLSEFGSTSYSWFVATQLLSLPPFSHGILPSVSLSSPFLSLIRTSAKRLRFHPNPG